MDDRKPKELIREELKKLSGLSWGERLGYIWDYYKPLMAAVLVVIFLVSMGLEIYHNAQMEQLMNAYFINSNNVYVDSEAMTSEFTEYIGGLEDKQEINIDTTLSIENELNQYSTASQTKITALASANALDILVMDEDTFNQYYAQGFFADLGSVLSEEQLEEWADLLIYREPVTEDDDPYEELAQELSSETDSDKGREEQENLDADPDSETAIAAAIDLTDSPALQKYEVYTDKKVYGGIFVQSEYKELFGQFFEFLLQ